MSQSGSATDVTGSRLAAGLIDVVLAVVLFVAMAAAFGTLGSTDNDGDGFAVSLSGAPFVLYLVIVLGYYYFFEIRSGQSIGKMAMGLRVVAIEGDLTAQKVLIRTVLRLVDFLPVFYFIAFILVIASSKKQRLGDMAAGTVVVKA